MLLQVLIALACVVAGIVQFVAAKSNKTSNLRILNTARRITAVGLWIAAFYIGYTLYHFGDANVVFCLTLGVLALGQTLFGMHTFMEPERTESLMSHVTSTKGPSDGTYA
jgi:hypothetical protein